MARRPRLFGAQYDSLPALLEKTLEGTKSDPVGRYLTFLCARQVRDSVRKHHGEFFRGRTKEVRALDELLLNSNELRKSLDLPDDEKTDFLDWYETMFLTEVKGVD